MKIIRIQLLEYYPDLHVSTCMTNTSVLPLILLQNKTSYCIGKVKHFDYVKQ